LRESEQAGVKHLFSSRSKILKKSEFIVLHRSSRNLRALWFSALIAFLIRLRKDFSRSRFFESTFPVNVEDLRPLDELFWSTIGTRFGSLGAEDFLKEAVWVEAVWVDDFGVEAVCAIRTELADGIWLKFSKPTCTWLASRLTAGVSSEVWVPVVIFSLWNICYWHLRTWNFDKI
jgi:hypothetical protein